MKQLIWSRDEALRRELEPAEDFLSESFLTSFAAIGALLLLDVRGTDAALPDAAAPEATGAPISLVADDAPAGADEAYAAYRQAFSVLSPSALTVATAPPHDEAPAAPDDSAVSLTILSAPAPVLSSAPLAVAPASNPTSTLAAGPRLVPAADALGGASPSSEAAAIPLAGVSAPFATGPDMQQIAAPAVATAHRVDATLASGGGVAAVNLTSALANEIAALDELATQVAFGAEALHIGVADVFAPFAFAPGFATLEAPAPEFGGDAPTLRTPAVFALATPRAA